AWPARWTHKLFRSRVSVFLLFRGFYPVNSAGNRPASDELLFLGLRVFCVSSVDGLFGGPYRHSRGFPDLGDRFGGIGSQLLAVGREREVRDCGIGIGPIDLFGFVFIRVLLQWLYRFDGDDRRDCDVICRDANNREDPVGREVFSADSLAARAKSGLARRMIRAVWRTARRSSHIVCPLLGEDNRSRDLPPPA